MAQLVMAGRLAPRNRSSQDRGSWIAATLAFMPATLTQPVPRYLLIAEGLMSRDPVSAYVPPVAPSSPSPSPSTQAVA